MLIPVCLESCYVWSGRVFWLPDTSSNAHCLSLLLAVAPPPRCRPLAYAWDIPAAASDLTTLRQLAANASSANSPRLSVPPGLTASLATGVYTVGMNVTNWLGVTSEMAAHLWRLPVLMLTETPPPPPFTQDLALYYYH